MSAAYKVQFYNKSGNPYHMAVYKKFPASIVSVAWQVRGIPPKSGPSNVDFSLNYSVSLSNWDPDNGTFTGFKTIPAELGSNYEAYLNQGVPDIRPSPAGALTQKEFSKMKAQLLSVEDQVMVANNTNQPVTISFGIDEKVAGGLSDVNGGEQAIFDSTPVYYVSAYRQIKEGQDLKMGIRVGDPVELQFNESNTYSVTVSEEGGKVILGQPQPVGN